MTPEERRLFAEMVDSALAGGGAVTLVDELTASGLLAEVWGDEAAQAALFESHGRHLAVSPLLELGMLRSDDGLPGRAVLPVLGSTEAPGRVTPHGLAVEGLVLAGGTADPLLVATADGDAYLVPATAVRVVPVAGLDPDLRLVEVSGTVDRTDLRPVPGPAWSVSVSRLARLLSFELLGVAAAALDLAVAHVRERRQFGRPLAAFQVVRHRLAGAAITRTGAWELALAAAELDDPDAMVHLVKASAGRAALAAVAEAQQVCGAMGFTAEFGLHRHVRRAYVLDALLGGSEAAEFAAGAAALLDQRLTEPLVAL